MYKAEGIFLFAHGENGELYKKKLNIVDLAITFRGNQRTYKNFTLMTSMKTI